ncbi:MAG: hypothetical protein GXO32_01825 [Crenarchaeota archaeon]|nr:hypothetical protein [Thermoproteota archaeon]
MPRTRARRIVFRGRGIAIVAATCISLFFALSIHPVVIALAIALAVPATTAAALAAILKRYARKTR